MKKISTILSILTFGLALTISPMLSIGKNALEANAAIYPLGNQLFFKDSKNNLHNFGAEKYWKYTGDVGDSSDYNLYYDGNGVLKLKGAWCNYICNDSTYPLTIDVEGLSLISVSKTQADLGEISAINCKDSKLTITGTGSLMIGASNEDGDKVIKAIKSNSFELKGSVDLSISMKSNLGGADSGDAIAIYAKEGIDISGNAKLSIDMGVENSSYGLFCRGGKINIDSEKDISISFAGEDNEKLSAFGIYNQATSILSNNGDITIGGSGKVVLTNKSGEFYSHGIYSGGTNSTIEIGNTNKDGVQINDFQYGIDSTCFTDKDEDKYDVVVNAGVLKIASKYENSYGIGVNRNGVAVQSGIFEYVGNGCPIVTNVNDSHGFDVVGNSKVLINSKKPINTFGGTCNIDLFSGYFVYGDENGKNNDMSSFYVQLDGSSYVDDLAWTMTDSTNNNGGWIYELDDRYSIPFTIKGSDIYESIFLSVDGVNLDKDHPCFVNGSDEPTASDSNANVIFDYDKNFLYLIGYEGGKISYNTYSKEILNIVVLEDSIINSEGYGIHIENCGSLTISSREASLCINVDNESSYVYGICVEKGDLVLKGDLELIINVKTDGNTDSRGIDVVDGNLSILQHASVSATNSNNYENILFSVYSSAVYAHGNTIIDTTGYLMFDTSKVKKGSIALSSGTFTIKSFSEIEFFWNEQGNGEAYYPDTAFDSLTGNITTNDDSTNGKLSVAMGKPVLLTLINAHSNKCEDKFPENSTAYIYAEEFEGIEFEKWDSSIENVVADLTNPETSVSIGESALTIEAKYDFFNGRQPRFDSRGANDRGYIAFDLKGNPAQVRLVNANGDENDAVISDNKFDKSKQLYESQVPGGSYKIAAQYKSIDNSDHWLFSDPFTITYGSPAAQHQVHLVDGKNNETIVSAPGGHYQLPECSFADPDDSKKFVGWIIGSLDGNLALPGDNVELYNDIFIYAKYGTRTQHLVFFETNGGTGSMNGKVYDERNYTLPECSLTAPEGKEFDCWECDGQTYQVGEQITNVKEDLTLKAVWKDKTVINPEPETPVKKGMGGGAIAVIVIFSVLGLGIGGFAIYWFVIAKKTFKQLVEICKGFFNKIFKKKK